jgi:hypothetical protein
LIAELWSEDITRGGKVIHQLLKQEPIKPPSLRFVQNEVGKLNRGVNKLDPRIELRLWQHEWYDDPEKVPVLLTLHYIRIEVEGPGSAIICVEEASWALKIAKFFDLSSPTHAYLLFRFAVTYAKWEYMAKLLDKTFDTQELDMSLLEFSGFLRGKLPATTLGLTSQFLSDLKRLRPEYLGDSRTEELGPLGSLDELPTHEGTGDASLEIDQWKRLEWELARIERERFIAEGRFRGSDNTDWERSADKTYFENQESDIRLKAADLYATPEGKTSYELFTKDINVQTYLQFP